MFNKHGAIVEEVKAWKECLNCMGKGKACYCATGGFEFCSDCNGEGGKWHEAIYFIPPKQAYLRKHLSWSNPDRDQHVYKTSTLVREYEICTACRGSGRLWSLVDNCRIYCFHCLKDVDGRPTGAEPGTAMSWQVKNN